MTLPASGVITLNEIITEFGGPSTLTSYYRGGTYVPNISANVNIPTSGTISLNNFYSSSATRGLATHVTSAYGNYPITSVSASTTQIIATMLESVNSGVMFYSTISSGVAWSSTASGGQPIHDTAFGGSYWIGGDSETAVSNAEYPVYGTSATTFNGLGGLTTSGFNGGAYSTAYGAGVYVIAFGNGYMTATNPTTYAGWTYRGANLHSITGYPLIKGTLKFINNTFVAVSPSSNPFWSYSTTGTSFTQGPFPLTPANVASMFDVAYGAGVYCFVGADSAGGSVWTSPNLTSSTITKRTIPVTGTVYTCIWVASVSRFVIGTNSGQFASSPNGITWTAFKVAPTSIGSFACNCGWAGSTFCLFGTSTGYILKVINTDIP